MKQSINELIKIRYCDLKGNSSKRAIATKKEIDKELNERVSEFGQDEILHLLFTQSLRIKFINRDVFRLYNMVLPNVHEDHYRVILPYALEENNIQKEISRWLDDPAYKIHAKYMLANGLINRIISEQDNDKLIDIGNKLIKRKTTLIGLMLHRAHSLPESILIKALNNFNHVRTNYHNVLVLSYKTLNKLKQSTLIKMFKAIVGEKQRVNIVLAAVSDHVIKMDISNEELDKLLFPISQVNPELTQKVIEVWKDDNKNRPVGQKSL